MQEQRRAGEETKPHGEGSALPGLLASGARSLSGEDVSRSGRLRRRSRSLVRGRIAYVSRARKRENEGGKQRAKNSRVKRWATHVSASCHGYGRQCAPVPITELSQLDLCIVSVFFFFFSYGVLCTCTILSALNIEHAPL